MARSAAGRPGSTTSSNRRSPRHWARRKPAPWSRPAPTPSSPATWGASCRSRRTCERPGHRIPVLHTMQLLDRAQFGVGMNFQFLRSSARSLRPSPRTQAHLPAEMTGGLFAPRLRPKRDPAAGWRPQYAPSLRPISSAFASSSQVCGAGTGHSCNWAGRTGGAHATRCSSPNPRPAAPVARAPGSAPRTGRRSGSERRL